MGKESKEKKEAVSWTIDESVVRNLEKEAEIENRSVSFIANEKLKKEVKK